MTGEKSKTETEARVVPEGYVLLELNRTIVESAKVLVPKSQLIVGEDGELDLTKDEDALFEAADEVYFEWSAICPEREVMVVGEAGCKVEDDVKTIWDA